MIDPSFFYLKYIDKSNRIECAKIAEAVFGSAELAEFTEKFVPANGRVPIPKTGNFTNYLQGAVKHLFAILNPNGGNNEEYIGFILLSDIPHKHSIGIGLGKNYAQRGIAKTALAFALESLINLGVEMPIFAHTSNDNKAANELLKSVDFQFVSEITDFMGPHNMYEWNGFANVLKALNEVNNPNIILPNEKNINEKQNETLTTSNDILCIFVNDTSLKVEGRSTTSKWYEAFLKHLIDNYSKEIELSDEKTTLNKIFSKNPEDYDRFGESIKYNRIVGYMGWFYNTHKSSSIKIGIIRKLALELKLLIDIVV
jgi:ribosomal protein S18 acetylase RimI-like enzyme